MKPRDSIVYSKLIRLCKKQLQWIGLSEAARDILVVLLVEKYWTNKQLSPEEIAVLTGYSRGSISVALSQLKTLGFVDGYSDFEQTGRGRKRIRYSLSGGFLVLINFGIRRIRMDFEGINEEIQSMKLFLDPSETNAKRALELIEKETALGASYLKEYAARIKSKAIESDIDLAKSP